MLEEFVKIRILNENDFSTKYLNWFLDSEVVKYSENQFKNFSRAKQIKYIRSFENNIHKYLYGIFYNDTHIGNIEINSINYKIKTAEVTYIIGEKQYWGRGVASYCISLISEIAKKEFKLKKLYAGCASGNIGSIKALEKNNFLLMSSIKNHFFYQNKFMDALKFYKNL